VKKNIEREEHPAFAMAEVNRVHATPGAALFDSELQHSEYVVLRIKRAMRRRELKRDWITDAEQLVEVSMSMAQWGALVSSFGTNGVPVTLNWLSGEGDVERLSYEPRMAESLKEIEGAATELVHDIRWAADELREAFDNKASRREVEDKLSHLEAMINNARADACFTATQFSKHVENTVTKARADIEAMAASAQQRGIEAGSLPLMELPSAD
jgi:hypothetical protein